MKNLLIVTFLLLSLDLSANELDWVDKQVDAIKPPRVGVKSSTVARIKDPFIFLKKGKSKASHKATNRQAVPNGALASKTGVKKQTVVKTANRSFKLGAIINNSALINGKWYKLNDKVGSYTLSKVEPNQVVLKYKTKSLILSTKTNNLNLKFNNK